MTQTVRARLLSVNVGLSCARPTESRMPDSLSQNLPMVPLLASL